MTTYKPGDKVLVSKVELREEKRYLTWPFDDERSRVGEFVQTVANRNFKTHVIELHVGNWIIRYSFTEEEVQPFDEDQFDTEGVTAAKNVAYEALNEELENADPYYLGGPDPLKIADRIIEDLKAAGVVFPDSIKDPHAFTEEQK